MSIIEILVPHQKCIKVSNDFYLNKSSLSLVVSLVDIALKLEYTNTETNTLLRNLKSYNDEILHAGKLFGVL